MVVNVDGAGSVMREILQLPWLVPVSLQPRSLAGLTPDPGAELSFALVPYHPAGQARAAT